MNLLERFSLVRMIVFDLDGVLTNGKVLLMGSEEWIREMEQEHTTAETAMHILADMYKRHACTPQTLIEYRATRDRAPDHLHVDVG